MSDFQYWFLCIIVLVCVAVALVRGSILEEPKTWFLKFVPRILEKKVNELLYCSMCLGFWVGLVGTAILRVHGLFLNRPVTWICSGFLVSILAIFTDRMIFGRDSRNNLGDDDFDD